MDLKQNGSGVYLKLSERNGKSRNTVLIPASGIGRLTTFDLYKFTRYEGS